MSECPCPPIFRDAAYCPDCPLRGAQTTVMTIAPSS